MTANEQIRMKIIELLTVYPRMSPTMLQAGLGPSLAPAFWRPIYDGLIAEGSVVQYAELPPLSTRRTHPYTVIELTRVDVSNIKVPQPPSVEAEAV